MSSIATNKKAYLNYDISEKMEAGIELLGLEVKSLRARPTLLDGSYVIIRGAEAFLSGFHIAPYQTNNTPITYDPDRLRRLLLSKKQILDLATIDANKKLTIVPLSMYNKDGKIKVEIALAKGKKKYDKREAIKKRDTDRDLRRDL